MVLFDFANYWWLYASFVGLLIVALIVDLGLLNRADIELTHGKALRNCAVWFFLALIFNFWLYHFMLHEFELRGFAQTLTDFSPTVAAKSLALEFMTAYLVEESLSVDNLFVFIVIFSYFQIPLKYQRRVLFYGILGALIFRGAFIATGAYLMHYRLVILAFGVFLIFTGVRFFFPGKENVDLESNWTLRTLKKFIPVTTKFSGHSFFVKESGQWVATPLFVCLAMLEVSDVFFAFDSVPAVFAVSKEPLIVFTSNIFAILGLRSLFFLIAGMMDRFHFLKIGLAFILIFIGAKMVYFDEYFEGKFPITASLGVVLGLLLGSIFLSLFFPRNTKD